MEIIRWRSAANTTEFCVNNGGAIDLYESLTMAKISAIFRLVKCLQTGP